MITSVTRTPAGGGRLLYVVRPDASTQPTISACAGENTTAPARAGKISEIRRRRNIVAPMHWMNQYIQRASLKMQYLVSSAVFTP